MLSATPIPTHPVSRAVESRDLMVLTDIYRDDINLVCWQAPALDPDTMNYLHRLASSTLPPKITTVLSARHCTNQMRDCFQEHPARRTLVAWLAECIDLFASLFEQERVGVRLRYLTSAMCPRFHVDNIPVRLVHTLVGPGTEWLTEDNLDRSRLGRGNGGLPDEHSGLLFEPRNIQRLNAGDVALLKGSGWVGNEHAGLVHRSPAVTPVAGRWVLTLDLAD
ncbi:DUF1826 domain-containing protein [Saccharospirillum alexandrii]|uniref:DUF1826 domain-containing protein n=1 Tax=Saccharospirillum alexandrii TaxID=2448477 RepID=UPI000FD7EF25|nr:DUF1826 domain-containing protein [Saccharospirillum alexandrii]